MLYVDIDMNDLINYKDESDGINKNKFNYGYRLN